MIVPTILAAALAFQGDDIIDYRVLALARRGTITCVTSADPLGDAYTPQLDGSLLLAQTKGHRGRIARLWLDGGHPRTKLRITLDAQRSATWAERIGAAFEDGRPPFLSVHSFAPARAAGARVSYPEIGYMREALITLSSKIDGFEVELVEGESVDSTMFPGNPKTQDFDIPQIEIKGGETQTLGVVPDGEGTIQELALIPAGFTDDDLAKVRLRVFVDGEAEPGIDVSLARLFVRDSLKLAFAGGAIVNTDKEMRLKLPIPFANGCKVEIENRGEHAVKLKANAKLNRDPLIADTRRLRIREFDGEAPAGQRVIVGVGDGTGHVVGMTLKLEGDLTKLAGAHVGIESDGSLAYRSVCLASAFDGGSEFGKVGYTTLGSGFSIAGEKSISGFSLRLGRPIPFEHSYREWIEAPTGERLKASGAFFVYLAPPAGSHAASAASTAAKSATKPGSAPALKPGSAPVSKPASTPASKPALPTATPPATEPTSTPASKPASSPATSPAGKPASAPAQSGL